MKDRFEWGFVPAMFFRPRKTMAKIIDGRHREWVLAIAAVIGAGSALLQASEWRVGQQYGFWPVLLAALVAGALYGVLSLYLSGWLLTVSGRWVGAKGDFGMVRAALAWGRTPMLAACLVFLMQLLVFGDQVFGVSSRSLGDSYALREIYVLSNLAIVVFSVWSLLTTVAALSEVQRLSIAKTFGNLLIAGLMLLPLLILVVMFFSVFNH
ncbi:YIP1 family protein [Rhodanobacter hydrolyticus]|uniref:YIP1 family protein n=1 Tax=Rhodanobacter hydrolyticus TaxID=2250595 RepID=A0ABW8JAQ5_9GAMM